jgi:hypothetical protein
VYAQRFDRDTTRGSREYDNGLYPLKRAKVHGRTRGIEQTGRLRLGAVVEAGRIRCAVDVAPYFGKAVDTRLDRFIALEVSKKFNLNKYSDKETFHLFRSSKLELAS